MSDPTHKKSIPKGRDAHGNAVPLSVSRTHDSDQADPGNLAERRGRREAGTMARVPTRSKKAKH